MPKLNFEEGDVWAHYYGGIPEMNAHYKVENIDGDLTLVSAYAKIKCSDVELPSKAIYFCGKYDGSYYPAIFEKELKAKNG